MDMVLQMDDYNATGDIVYEHPGWTKAMTRIPRGPLEESLYRNEWGKPSQAANVEAEAEERVVHEGIGSEV